MRIQLDDNEIKGLSFPVPDGYTSEDILLLYANGIARAQLKQVVEWLESVAVMDGTDGFRIRQVDWQALKKEADNEWINSYGIKAGN